MLSFEKKIPFTHSLTTTLFCNLCTSDLPKQKKCFRKPKNVFFCLFVSLLASSQSPSIFVQLTYNTVVLDARTLMLHTLSAMLSKRTNQSGQELTVADAVICPSLTRPRRPLSLMWEKSWQQTLSARS